VPLTPDGDEKLGSSLDRIRARTIALAMFAVPAVVAVLRRTAFPSVSEERWDLVSSLAFQLGVGTLLILYLRARRVSVRPLVGRIPRGWRPWALAAMAVPLLVFSFGTAALQFSIVTTVAPGLAADVHDVAAAAGAATATGSILAQSLIGVLAAGLEELLFRGVLLARWARKWGTKPAIAASSACFALLHLDLIGAFVFALAMALLYLHTRSLLVPFLCHALNNLMISLSDLVDGSRTAEGLAPDDLGPEWGAAALALCLSIPVLVWFFRTYRPRGAWRLPSLDATPEEASTPHS
jgi:membrane protease YdiL (CAAX protease family)